MIFFSDFKSNKNSNINLEGMKSESYHFITIQLQELPVPLDVNNISQRWNGKLGNNSD